MNKDWLYQKYIIEELSGEQIASLCGFNSKQTIYDYLRRYKIPVRTRSEMQREYKNHQWRGGSWSSFHAIAIRAWEAWWNQKIPTGYLIHHVDGNYKNNEITNLALVTRSFHAKRHGFGKTLINADKWHPEAIQECVIAVLEEEKK